MARRRISSWFLCVIVVIGSSCEGSGGQVIRWDLSSSHAAGDVDFEPSGDVDGTVIEGVQSVRIELPEGRIFEADSDIHDVSIGTQGETLQLVAVEFQPESVDDAYRRAVAFAREWDMPTDTLDRWYRTASRPDDDLTTIGRTGAPASIGGRDGPQAFLEVRPFDEAAPALVSFQLQWRT